MRLCHGLVLMLLSGGAYAASGSWSADDTGPGISWRGVAASSPPLAPSGAVPAQASIREVVWRFQLLNPSPDGLRVKLCTPQRCIWLGSAHGRSNALSGTPAGAPLRFVYHVEGKGVLYPPLRVTSNQVIVNYQ